MRLTLTLITFAVTSPALAQQQLADSLAPRVDAVFARFAHPDTPGCALGVYQNGAIVYSKGYGSANLEYCVPITPTTPFISGSVAKQFTAASIALLVEQGRISLDDDVRKYIPELPDYGAKITIDQLVHHTSGLRDFWALVQVSGMRYDDGYTVRRRDPPRGPAEASQLPARHRVRLQQHRLHRARDDRPARHG